MAMLFDLDAQRSSHARGFGSDTANAGGPDAIDTTFALFTDQLGGLETVDALRRVHEYQSKLSAVQNGLMAKLEQETGNDRATKRALNDGKTSRGKIAKAAKRGAAAAKNADLIDRAESGGLSEEQFDVIADTSAKTNGAAATDEAFIAKVADIDPDQAQAIAKEFIADQANTDGTQTEHDRQRLLRRASKYYAKKNGLDTINLGGDGIAAKNMWAKIQARADELYQADGGRDLDTGSHPRTREHRLFDAAHEIICGVTTTPTGWKQQPRHNTDGSGGSRRPQIFVGITLDKYLGHDRASMAEQIGLGLIPDSVLADYLEHADVIGVLYDRNGQPLWLGRARRDASVMQRYALIARDKACVQCGADHQHCDVHHRTPWNAPAKGQTNLDELVLLCGPCHRQLHAENRTIYQDTKGTWRTRPATPQETPPPRPAYHQRE